MASLPTSSHRPWLDVSVPLESRVELLLAAMTLREKVGQLHLVANLSVERDRELMARGGVGSSLYASGATAGNERDSGLSSARTAEVQRVAVEESRLGVPVMFGRDVIHGHRTVVPIPLGLAASWDEDLVRRCCRTAAGEASADGVDWTFAPMVDLSEEPRWGRVAESLGEAPVLAGRLAAAMVQGFQGGPADRPDRGDADGGDGGRVSIAACAKHFVGYGLVQGGRDYDTVTVGENTLRNLHLRPFRAAVDAGVESVMAAFNDVDGVPLHAHRHLLRDVLKGEWGFDGVVVADWLGVAQLVGQGVAADLRDAARQALLAGVDIDMASGAYAAYLPELVESGDVPLEVLDDSVRRVLRMKFRTGVMDQPSAHGRGPEIDQPARELARDAAIASMVLVKNDGLLPLRADRRRIHLTGPFAQEQDALLGTWVLDGRVEDVVSPAAALRGRLAPQDLVVSDGRFSDVAISLVREADVTIALVGEHRSRSGEDRCISTLSLPAGQLEVLEQQAAIGKPLVVVVYTGRPLDLGRVLELADAVVVAWHPGIEAGNALADVLFGTRSPRGRLPMTFPRTVGHLPSSSHQRATGRRIGREEDPRRGRYLDALTYPDLTFGFGLTYTTFAYGELTLSAPTLSVDGSGPPVTARITVTNTGPRAGREVVQLYVHDHVAVVTRPLVVLADWRSLDLEPGEIATVEFVVTATMFGYYDHEMRWRVDPGDVDVIVGPHAAQGFRARLLLTK